jgi:mannitol-specific phosphotransferase system IIBC component
MQLENSSINTFNSVMVATYWFAALVFIFFSWLFYWFVHRLKTSAWIIAQFTAVVIAVVSTSTLLSISHEHQQKLEQEAKSLEETQATKPDDATEQVQSSQQNNQIETLNLGEE